MSKDLNSVRNSSDGFEFQVAWTARKVLRLLDVKSNLKAVAVEGVSPFEETSGVGKVKNEGLLSVDTTEYYGGERFDDATRIIYTQLKHSTVNPTVTWELSTDKFKQTLGRFAKIFLSATRKHGIRAVSSKLQFQFVSNRPISPKITAAFSAIKSNLPIKDAALKRTIGQLMRATKLSGTSLKEFVSVLDLRGSEVDYIGQNKSLQREIHALSTTLDMDAYARLKELVRSKGTTREKRANVIRFDDVLAEFNCVVEDLFPAPNEILSISNVVSREQEPDIVAEILRATTPVIIRAEGGMGKSVLAQRLGTLLPEGSEAIVFDGFAGGNYRSRLNPRHRHDRGLVHLANILASRGLCLPMLPDRGVPPDAYLRAFRARLIHSAAKISREHPGSILLVVLDAADNSMMAANDLADSRCFVRDLLLENPPEGCKIVAFTRPGREKILKLPDTLVRIDLKGFSLAETREYLSQKYSGASEEAISRFHRSTRMNPRVQANALSLSTSLTQLLASLGPKIGTVERIIQGQFEAALEKVKSEQGNAAQISRICSALAVLPPLVPIKVLAVVADVTEDTVRDFVSDFAAGQKILISDDAVQFHDEPVEDWFRNTFSISTETCADIVSRITPMSANDKYVATIMPQMLLRAKKYPELVSLALAGPKFKGKTAIEERDIQHETAYYALQAAVNNGKYLDVAKLLSSAGVGFAMEERVSKFFFANADLVSLLSDDKSLFDRVFRKREWRQDSLGYIQSAAMLARSKSYRYEAEEFLRYGIKFLNSWAQTPEGEGREITRQHIAEYAYAILHIRGPVSANKFLSRCRPKAVVEIVRAVVKRLIDASDYPLLDSWLKSAGENIHLKLGIAHELNVIGRIPSSEWLSSAIKSLASNPIDVAPENPSDNIIALSIISLAELALCSGVCKEEVLSVLLAYTPAHKHRLVHLETQKDAVFRAASLLSVLNGRELLLENVVPDNLAEVIKDKNSEHNQDVQEFKRTYAPLLPWYAARAKVIVGQLTGKSLDAVFVSLAKSGAGDRLYALSDYEQRRILNQIAITWMESLCWSGRILPANLATIYRWVNSHDGIFIPTFINLARIVSHNAKSATSNYVSKFILKANQLIQSEHADAVQDAENYTSIARALMPIDPTEAYQYFNLAYKKLNGLGPEVYSQLFSFIDLAKKAGGGNKSYPEEAYRLARITEVFGTLYNHKFPWEDSISGISALCPKSGLAIASRWDDRNVTPVGNTLPRLIVDLLGQNEISPAAAIALHALPGYSELVGRPELLLGGRCHKQVREKIFQYLMQDIEFMHEGNYGLRKLFEFARTNKIDSARLAERVSYNAELTESQGYDAGPFKSARRSQFVGWGKILKDCDLYSPRGIEAAVSRYWGLHVPLGWEALFVQIQKHIQPDKRTLYVDAIANASLEVWQYLEALKVVSKKWADSKSVQSAVKSAVETIIRNKANGFLREHGFASDNLETCATISGNSKSEILCLVLSSLSNSLQHMNAASCYGLTGEIAKILLSPKEAVNALGAALSIVEPILRPEDGDGRFTELLIPPKSWDKTIAAFLFRMLSDPHAGVRWRAAHAVRRLAALGEAKIFDELVSLFSETKLPAFTDARYPFYYRHGRLYLLISIARIANENPGILKKHFQTLLDLTFNTTDPHVLMRHFSASAALDIINSGSVKGVSRDLITKLREINQSRFPSKTISWNAPSTRKKYSWRSHGVRLDSDFEEYWLNPLSKVFNIDESKVARQIHAQIVRNWGEKYLTAWKEDLRAKNGQFGSMATVLHHGSYPEADRLYFYQEYHAMFCVAGKLLDKLPTYDEIDGSGDLWQDWFNRHLLTRVDGKWVSDRRDFGPLSRGFVRASQNDKWRWTVMPSDFDSVLGIEAGRLKRIAVWGRKRSSLHSKAEEVRVSSALVSPKTSLALLSALQTIDCFHDYKIPSKNEINDNFEFHGKDFKMSAWVNTPDRERGLDQFDSFAGHISYPPPRPGKALCKICHLTSDSEQRVWESRSKPVLEVSVWGDSEKDSERGGSSGEWMNANFTDVCRLLREIKRDLIIEVEIQHEDGKTKTSQEDFKYKPNSRLYVLKGDGRLHTLCGSRNFGTEISKRTKS